MIWLNSCLVVCLQELLKSSSRALGQGMEVRAAAMFLPNPGCDEDYSETINYSEENFKQLKFM